MSAKDEVDAAVQAAVKAYPDWRNTPVTDRIKPLFKLKVLLDEHLDEIGRTITTNSKTTPKPSPSCSRHRERRSSSSPHPDAFQTTGLARCID